IVWTCTRRLSRPRCFQESELRRNNDAWFADVCLSFDNSKTEHHRSSRDFHPGKCGATSRNRIASRFVHEPSSAGTSSELHQRCTDYRRGDAREWLFTHI